MLPMQGYTKLFGSIVASTIWRAPKETKIVWITMLAISNKHGHVEAAIPGLADLARLTIPEVEKALAELMAPDKYSRTKDHEGRRIEEIDGGWAILNHAKYRAKMSTDERRAYLREKKREGRERGVNTGSTPVNKRQPESTKSTHTEADPKAEAGREYTGPFLGFWERYPRKVGKDAAWRFWKNHTPPVGEVHRALDWQLISKPWTDEGGKFIPNPSTYLNQGRWKDEPPKPRTVHRDPSPEVTAKTPPEERGWGPTRDSDAD